MNALIGYSQAGSKFVFGEQLGGGPHGGIRISSAAHHHFHLQPVRDPVLPGRDAEFWCSGMAIVMQRVMGASGAESTNVAASIFMGQTEAPAHHPAVSRGAH